MSTEEELSARRIRALDEHLSWHGLEVTLVDVRPEDVKLPASARDVRAAPGTYEGDLHEVSSAGAGDDLRVEYEFSASAAVKAVLPGGDAAQLSWVEGPVSLDEEVEVEGLIEMTGVMGILYEGDELSGEMEYVRLERR